MLCEKETCAIHDNKRRISGFTLLELLIAILVLSAMVGMVHVSFFSVTSTMNTARDAAERLRFKQIVWRSLTSSLQGIYTDAACLQPEYQFLGENKDGALGPGDSLRYATSLPMNGTRSLPGVNKIVTCKLVERSEVSREAAVAIPVDEERPSSILMIREEPLRLESQDFVDNSQDAGWDIFEQAVPVATMDILYYDGTNNEWAEEWDSLSQRRLPGGVWIKINFPRSEEERAATFKDGIDLQQNPDLEIMMPLYLGRDVEFPFPDFNTIRYDSDETAQTNKK